MCINCTVMENKNIGLINYQQEDFIYQDDSSLFEDEESIDEDDAMTQSAETGDKTDQEISTHELKYDDSESYQFEDVIEGDENCGKNKNVDDNSDSDEDSEDEDYEGLRIRMRKFFTDVNSRNKSF